ncbi:putative ribonuclease H-like domain-containing protein [Tanacetum coccineum]
MLNLCCCHCEQELVASEDSSSRRAIWVWIIAQEDLNLKFLSSLPPEWNTHVVVEQNIKKTVGTSSGGQNLAFMTAPSSSSTNDANTAYSQVSAASPSVILASHKFALMLSVIILRGVLILYKLRTLSMGASIKSRKISFRIQTTQDKKETNRRTSRQILAIDGVGFDWSDMEEEQVQTNMALMAFSNSEVYTDKTCSKTCLNNYETLKKHYDDMLAKQLQTKFESATYKRGLDTVEAQLVTYRKNEVLFSEEVAVLKREVGIKQYEINTLKTEFEKLKQEKDAFDFKIEKFDKASKDLDQLLESQITDKSKKGLGYSAVPPPHPLIYNRPNKLDLSYSGLDEFKEPEFKGYGPENSKKESNVVKESDNSKENSDKSLVKEQESQVSDDEEQVESMTKPVKKTVIPTAAKIEKPVRKSVRYAEMYRSQRPRGNQRNWNGQKSNQLGSEFVMYNKACFNCGSFKDAQKNCTYHQKKKVVSGNNYNRVDNYYYAKTSHHRTHKNVTPRAVLLRTGLKPLSTAKSVYTAHPKPTVHCARPKTHFFKSAQSTVQRPFYKKPALTNRHFNHKVNTVRPKVVNTARSNRTSVNAARTNGFNAVKPRHVGFGELFNPIGKPNMMIKDLLTVDVKAMNEAVSTACYVQNRVLVVKPHNKTPYELFRGFKPALSFMRPFGCHVTILNTLDSLGKFDGKSDEGFFVGYSLSSKAFRVYNTRTKRVEENLHIGFLENKPMIEGTGTSEVNSQECIVMPIWKDTSYFDSPTENVDNGEPKTADDAQKQDEDGLNNENAEQERFSDDSSSKDVNAVGKQVNTASLDLNTSSLELNAVGPSVSTPSPNEEDNTEEEPEVDLGNITNSYIVPTTPNTRIHKDHPIDNVIGEVQSTVQTRRILNQQALLNLYLIHPGWKQCRKNFCNSNFNKFRYWWISLMERRPLEQNGSRGIVIRNKAWLGVQSTLWVASSTKSMVCNFGKLSVEQWFKQGQELIQSYFIKKQKGDILLVQVYVDDIIFGSTNKELCTGFEKLMKDKFQMSSMGELTFFLGLQVQQKEDGIFISQDKYVAKILKNFNYSDVKSASTPIDLEKPLVKDGDADDIDVHLYRSMIGSLMYLTASRPDIMFAVCACARFQVTPKTSHLLAVKKIFRYLKGKPTLYLWYSRDSPFELVAYTDSDYAGATLDRKSTTGGYLLTKGFDAGRFQYLVSINTARQKITTARQMLMLLRWMGTKVANNVVKFLSLEALFEGRLVMRLSIRSWVTDWKAATTASSLEAEQDSVNPVIYTSCIEQFWATAKVQTVNGVRQLQALVDKKRVIVTESSIRRDLHLDDAEGTDCLPTATIFEELARMGYEKPSQKLTFYKAFFSPQWKYFIHTITQCLSAKSTAWNEFSSSMASLIICLATNQKFNLSKYIFDAMVKHLDGGVKFLLYPRFLQVFINQQLGNMSTHKKIFVNPFHTKKVFANMKRAGKDFSGRITPLFDTMMVQPVEEMGEDSDHPTDSTPIHIIDQPSSSSQPKKDKPSKKAQRQEAEVPQDEAEVPQDEAEHEESVPTPSNDPQPSGEDSMQLTDLMILCTKLQTQVLDLQKAKDAQAKEIAALKKRIQRLERRKMSRPTGLKRLSKVGMSRRVKYFEDQESLDAPEDASKQGRSIKDIDADVIVLEDDMMHVEAKVDDEQSKKPDDSTVGEAITTASIDDSDVPTTNEEMTLAKVVTTAATTATTTRPKDRGVVPKVHLKRKDQIALDEQIARDIQAKLDAELLEEQKLARKQEEEANIALIESWENTQAMMEANRLLAERLQSKEREELTDGEKAKLFMELMEKRRNHFAALKAQEKRNRPPTKA